MANISKAIKLNALKAIVENPVYAARLERLLSDVAFENLFNGVINTITIINPEKLLSKHYCNKESRVVLYDTAEVVNIDYATGDFKIAVKAIIRKYYRSEEDFNNEFAGSITQSDEFKIEHWSTRTLTVTTNVRKEKDSIEVSYI